MTVLLAWAAFWCLCGHTCIAFHRDTWRIHREDLAVHLWLVACWPLMAPMVVAAALRDDD